MSQDNRLLPLPAVDRALERPLGDIAQSKPYGVTQADTNIRDYLFVVLKRKWLILALMLVVTSLVTLQMYRMPSIYEASTTIQIEPKRASVLQTGKEIVINTGNNGTDPVYWQTQLRLLENPALARQVIKTLDLQNDARFFAGQSQTDLMSSLRRLFSREKTPAQTAPVAPVDELPVVKEEDVKGQQLTPEELARLEPYEETLGANLAVDPVVGTNLVTLRYKHTDPELAQKIVNTVADVFVYNNIQRETMGSEKSADVLASKIADLQLKVKAGDSEVLNYAIKNNLPQTSSPSSNLEGEKLAILSRNLLDAENERKNLQSIYEAAVKETDPNAIPLVQDSKRIEMLREKIEDLEQKRAELLVIYTPEWPEVRKIDEQIKPLKEALTKAPREVLSAMKSRYEAAVARENKLRQSFNQQRGTTTAQNVAEIQMSRMKMELETDKQSLATLMQRQRELENTTSDRTPNNITVTNYGRRGELIGPPRVRNILIALLLSLGAGIGLAFLLDYLDDTVKSVDDVDRYIHVPALALIPSNRSDKRLRGKNAPAEGHETTALALIDDARSPVAEAYRHLRTSLLLSSAGQPPRTILVTSSQPSEGKTTTAINTAVMLAQTGADVLLIDCDLRRPRIHAHFGMPNGRGVTNYLSGESDLESVMQPYDKLPNLRLMTSGPVPPNPAELLGSDEMRKLVGALSERFTHVVIDSPPAISFTDAAILSTLVDGVMLVVHGGKSSRAVVRRAKQQLLDVGAHLFGIVLNNVKLESHDYYYGSYYADYYTDDEPDAPGLVQSQKP
ncbi:MAG: polysaccharide biosynthesis transport protein [Blastocatellia bacterium]|jgi:capsular exopolysaccharide synthesis family protein|nr:polysaccharide biosynthesis transport protein [Blastocatellia bacterium]